MSISPRAVMWRLCGRNPRASPSFVYLPIRGPRLKSTPSVKAPATPWTTPEAIESWKPKRSVSQPPALQPQAASRIQTTEPRSAASTRYAESLTRSSSAPDMIDAVVQLKSRNARKKIRLMLFVRLGPNASLQGTPVAAGLVRHEARVDQPHQDDRVEVELLREDGAVPRQRLGARGFLGLREDRSEHGLFTPPVGAAPPSRRSGRAVCICRRRGAAMCGSAIL